MSLFDQAEELAEKARLEAEEAKIKARVEAEWGALRTSMRGKRLPSIQTSVSQVEKFESCPRKWAFEKIFRMREPGIRYGMTFGNVLHAVLERWLKADDQGRDRMTGKPVDIYPKGWQWERYGRRIQPEHDDLLKELVEQAIDKGMLVREPGREVEGEFWGVVQANKIDWSGNGNFSPIILVNGKVDLETPHKIGDHKSVKEMRWAKSARELFLDLQGGVYAHRKFQTNPDLDVIDFEHYCYDWTNKKVRVKRARDPETKKFGITRAQAAKTWERFRRAALDMQLLTNVQDPFKMPAARSGAGKGKDECTAFGGCGFISVCTKGSVEEFVKIRDRLALLSLPREAQEQIAEESTVKKTTKTAPAPTSKLKGDLNKKAAKAAKPVPAAEEDEDEEEEEAPAPKKKAKAAPVVEDEDEEAPAPKKKAKAAPVVEDEDEEEEEEAESESVWGDDEDEEEEEAPAPKKKAKAPVVEDEDEEEEAPAPKKKAKAPVVEDEDEDEEEDEDEDEAEEDDGEEGDERVASSLKRTTRADLMRLEKPALVDRLLSVFAALKGI